MWQRGGLSTRVFSRPIKQSELALKIIQRPRQRYSEHFPELQGSDAPAIAGQEAFPVRTFWASTAPAPVPLVPTIRQTGEILALSRSPMRGGREYGPGATAFSGGPKAHQANDSIPPGVVRL